MRLAKIRLKRRFPANAKLFLIMIALFILSIPASAQIDNCCYVDRQCTTNEEWVNGYYAYQNNQCAAPAQQQQRGTSSQSQPQGGTSENIDNCCFVDRQCNTDNEWTSGYWAFQRNQCDTPADSQAQSQPQRSASEEVNNCCFIGWQCSTDEEWRSGYWAFQYDQCDAPAQWSQQWSQLQQQRQRSSGGQDVKSGYENVKVDGVIVRRPTQNELCEALERDKQPLPPECEDN